MPNGRGIIDPATETLELRYQVIAVTKPLSPVIEL
jgi:hypothetical protein